MNNYPDLSQAGYGQLVQLLQQEDQIDFTAGAYAVTYPDAKDRIKRFGKHFQIERQGINYAVDGFNPLSIIGDEVIKPSVVHLLELFQKAISLPGIKINYITALKVHYGINNQHNGLTALYQPVLLYNRINNTGNTWEYTQMAYGGYYVYSPTNGFRLMTNNEMSWPANYDQHIRIDHLQNGNFGTRIKDIDALSALFSFQEIFSLINDNWSLGYRRVFVYNEAVEIEGNLSTKIRHSIILSPDDLSQEPIAEFTLKAANLAHLCPPNCVPKFTLY